MKTVFQMLLNASQSQEPVLITGETGTGKELAARAIHQIGPLRHRTFLPVDCSTLVPALMEAELFGYVRGAFTGAMSDRKGLFEAAHGGTVFLDEITEISVELQSKLLRTIQEHEFRPVGTTRWVEFSARIIVASNRDLKLLMQQGSFREDLYFRLNVLTIDLPPLREHKQDIPLLANHFLVKFSQGKGPPRELSEEALHRLMAYDWPGNVRELENCMRRAIALTPGPEVGPEDLPPYVGKSEGITLPAEVGGEETLTLREIERRAIVRAVAAANGDRLLAARLLGIGKTTIYRKLKEYGLG